MESAKLAANLVSHMRLSVGRFIGIVSVQFKSVETLLLTLSYGQMIKCPRRRRTLRNDNKTRRNDSDRRLLSPTGAGGSMHTTEPSSIFRSTEEKFGDERRFAEKIRSPYLPKWSILPHCANVTCENHVFGKIDVIRGRATTQLISVGESRRLRCPQCSHQADERTFVEAAAGRRRNSAPPVTISVFRTRLMHQDPPTAVASFSCSSGGGEDVSDCCCPENSLEEESENPMGVGRSESHKSDPTTTDSLVSDDLGTEADGKGSSISSIIRNVQESVASGLQEAMGQSPRLPDEIVIDASTSGCLHEEAQGSPTSPRSGREKMKFSTQSPPPTLGETFQLVLPTSSEFAVIDTRNVCAPADSSELFDDVPFLEPSDAMRLSVLLIILPHVHSKTGFESAFNCCQQLFSFAAAQTSLRRQQSPSSSSSSSSYCAGLDDLKILSQAANDSSVLQIEVHVLHSIGCLLRSLRLIALGITFFGHLLFDEWAAESHNVQILYESGTEDWLLEEIICIAFEVFDAGMCDNACWSLCMANDALRQVLISISSPNNTLYLKSNIINLATQAKLSISAVLNFFLRTMTDFERGTSSCVPKSAGRVNVGLSMMAPLLNRRLSDKLFCKLVPEIISSSSESFNTRLQEAFWVRPGQRLTTGTGVSETIMSFLDSHLPTFLGCSEGQHAELSKADEKTWAHFGLIELCARIVDNNWVAVASSESEGTPQMEILCTDIFRKLSSLEESLCTLLETFDVHRQFSVGRPALQYPLVFRPALNLSTSMFMHILQPFLVKYSSRPVYDFLSSSNNASKQEKSYLPRCLIGLLPSWVSSHAAAASMVGKPEKGFHKWFYVGLEVLMTASVDFSQCLSSSPCLALIELYMSVRQMRYKTLVERMCTHGFGDRPLGESDVAKVVDLAAKYSEWGALEVLRNSLKENDQLNNYFAKLHAMDTREQLVRTYNCLEGGYGMSKRPPYHSPVVQLPSISSDQPTTTAETRSASCNRSSQMLVKVCKSGNQAALLAICNDLLLYQQKLHKTSEIRANDVGPSCQIKFLNRVLDQMIKQGELRAADFLVETAKKVSIGSDQPHLIIDVITFNTLIKGYSQVVPPNLMRIEAIIEELESLKPFGIQPDNITYNSALNVAVILKNYSAIRKILGLMQSKTLCDRFTCSILLKGAGTESFPDDVAQAGFQILFQLETLDDPVLLNTVVDACRRPNNIRLLISHLLDGRPICKSLIASIFKVCSKNGRWAIATQMWATLKAEQCVAANSEIFDSFLEGALIVLTTNNRVEEAMAVYQDSRRMKINAETPVLVGLLKCCASQQKLHEALMVYDSLRNNSTIVKDVVINALLDCCVRAGNMNAALQILQDIETHVVVCSPDIVTYSTVIKGFCNMGDMTSAMQMFESLPKLALIPDTVLYNTILEGFASADDQKQVEVVFQRMLNDGARPSCRTLTTLIRMFGRRRELQKALQIANDVAIQFEVEFDAFVYTAIIAACVWNDNLSSALQYLSSMRTKFLPSSRLMGTLICGCLRLQSWDYLLPCLEIVQIDKIQIDQKLIRTLYKAFDCAQEEISSTPFGDALNRIIHSLAASARH